MRGRKVGRSGSPSPTASRSPSRTPEFKAEYERLAPYEELARIVIMRRASLGLTQAELAARMGTTASAIS